MSIEEPGAFHDSVKPIVYFNCLVGMGAYRQPNTTDAEHFCMQLYTIIFILLNWTMNYFGFEVINDASQYRGILPEARTMFQILHYTNSGVAVISPFLIWFQAKVLLDCLRRMPILDDNFRAILGARNDYRKQYIRLTCQVLAIFLVVSSVVAFDMWIMLGRRSLSKNIALSATLYYPMIVMLVLDSNFCTFVGYLGKKFRDLNDGILVLVEKPAASYPGKKIFVIPRKAAAEEPPSGRTKDTQAEGLASDDRHPLHEIRKAHLELCKLSRKINQAFGIQNLLSMGISFVMVTGMLYNIYAAVMSGNLTTERIRRIIPWLPWIPIYVFKIWIVNHSCWSISSEAERTGEVVYELLESKLDKELQKEIQEFAVQMIQNPVRFNACGFFTLDHTFVQGVIGSVTTYLVILIQMSHMPESPTSDAVVFLNGTDISTN